MKKDLLLVTVSELFFQVAESSIVVFGMIFFYQKFNSIFLAASPFILLHLFHAFLLPFFSKLIFRLGFKKSLIVASIFYILMALTTYISNSKLSIEVLILWALFYSLGNVFHYVPIIYILGSESKHSTRGKLFALRKIIFVIAAIVTPVLGGFISEKFGFSGLFAMCIVFYILTNVPILYLSKFNPVPPKSLLKTLETMRGKRIFLYKISEVFTNNMGDFWPIYVFIALSGSFTDVGILFAVVSFFVVIITYFTGNALDNRSRPRLYFFASIIMFVGWIFRALSFSYITILIADVIFKINANFKSQISEVIDYDLMNDHVNNARASVIILNEVIVNYLIAFVLFAGSLFITLYGFQVAFIIFGLLGFIFAQIMRLFLNYKNR